MSRGRPRSTQGFVAWEVHLNADLAAQVELLLLDPLRNKPRYGARGKLVEKLLKGWVEEQRHLISRQATLV